MRGDGAVTGKKTYNEDRVPMVDGPCAMMYNSCTQRCTATCTTCGSGDRGCVVFGGMADLGEGDAGLELGHDVVDAVLEEGPGGGEIRGGGRHGDGGARHGGGWSG
jgi:hypothetical protein